MKHYIIYLPGLGDHWDAPRRWALKLWRIFGVQTELVPMQWYDGKSYDEKLDRVLSSIDRAAAAGYDISLIGESAGASMASNVAVRRTAQLHRVVTLCGVVYPQADVSPVIYGRSPAFKTSMSNLVNSIQTITSSDSPDFRVITALYDPVVDHRQNILHAKKPIRVWSVGHLTTIALCLTLFSPIVIRQIKK
ncbi:MAG: hypothetical protein EOO17_02015 [Chloroflexi bacterium]|nr:MAG: hypothetical protein EOO17_02015 [Chloroflexota bacterium]